MKIDESTLAILSNVAVVGDAVLLNDGQLARKQYLEVNKVLEAMGGKWNRKTKGHVFPDNPEDKLESIILTGEYDKPIDYGYFPTPMGLVDNMILMAGLNSNMLVLEPSAGRGAIAERVARITGYDNVHCFELLDDNCEALMKCGFMKTECCDFLRVESKPLYDRVIMNPPFGKQQDIDHIIHAMGCIKQGGRLVSVMSSAVTFRENRKTLEFLELISKHRTSIITNPPQSFKLSGTLINTITLVIEM